ncbi:YihY/virulence factor BrkB family protein [Kineosporia sp. A_224]|uniref:YihY/virulence factor BrkB family protein n=1 Tax=Kineosporia sp. A_224 TaxID=1962180 RepID=UPI000B4AEB51|nr:YihY/virulence factor BrkB family protein [Kineosporia sp. A_224]
MKALADLNARWRATFAGRVWTRYSDARGNVLAGGIAYFAFFSVFPALAIGFTVLGLVLGRDSALQTELANYVNKALGTTVIGLEAEEGLVYVGDLVQSSALTFSAVTGFVILLFTGLGWLDAMRQGIRAVFGRPGGGNPLLSKVRDVGTLATFGLAVLVSAVASIVVSTASQAVLGWLGLDGVTGAGPLVRVLSALAILAVDTGIFLLLFRGLSGVAVPVRHLWQGALAGGVALGLLKVFGGVLLGELSAARRFLAAFAVVVGLLVWMNLVGRLTLLAASWSATRAAEAGELPALPGTAVAGAAHPDAADAADGADAGPGGAARGPRDVVAARARQAAVTARTPTYGVRAADRTTLAAGVVLGVAAAAAARVARGAVRAVVDAVRD